METPPPLQHGSFNELNCNMVGGEDSIEVYWASKSEIRAALHFWVAAFRTEIETCYEFGNAIAAASFDALLQSCHPDVQRDLETGRLALCQPLSWDEYRAAMWLCPAPLAQQLGLSDTEKFVGAMQMVKEWNHQVLLAEFKNRYFYFSWSTGA